MSDANRVGLAYVVESTYGTTPSGPPTLKNLRFTSESLQKKTSTVTSQELRSDRNTTDLIRVDQNAGGDMQIEFSYSAYDDLMEYALLSDATWPSAVDISHNSGSDAITIATSGSNFTLTLTTTNWVALGLNATTSVGKWVRLASFTAAANNGYAKIVSITGSNKVLTVTQLAMSAGTQNSGTVTVRQMPEIKTGVTLKSMSIEKSYTDLSSTFAVYTGMCIDGFSLDFAVGAVAKGSFSLIGKNEVSGSATVGTGTNTAAPTFSVMNTVDHISALMEGGTALSITKLSLALKNNLRARGQIATLGAISIGTGAIEVTGSIEAYFTSNTLLDKYRNMTATSLALKIVDASSNAYVIDLPNVKFSDGKAVSTGINTDVFLTLNFTAIMHSTELIAMRIARSTAP